MMSSPQCEPCWILHLTLAIPTLNRSIVLNLMAILLLLLHHYYLLCSESRCLVSPVLVFAVRCIFQSSCRRAFSSAGRGICRKCYSERPGACVAGLLGFGPLPAVG